MNFLEWLGSSDKAITAERDAQLTYGRNFALVTLFVQTTVVLYLGQNHLTAVALGIWTIFLSLCLGLPPPPSFLPKATTALGHQIAGACMTLFGIGFQWMLGMIVLSNVGRTH